MSLTANVELNCGRVKDEDAGIWRAFVMMSVLSSDSLILSTLTKLAQERANENEKEF